MDAWVAMVKGEGECEGVLDAQDGKVGDGIKYHILDVWVDGLVNVDSWEVGMERGIMRPIESVIAGALTKTLRQRARGLMEDIRLQDTLAGGQIPSAKNQDPEDTFEGFGE